MDHFRKHSLRDVNGLSSRPHHGGHGHSSNHGHDEPRGHYHGPATPTFHRNRDYSHDSFDEQDQYQDNPQQDHYHHDKKKGHAGRNYKLVADPAIHPSSQKIYRFDGIQPGTTRAVEAVDPRSRWNRLWTKRQAADLPVPKFKYDANYVGQPLPKEVTFTNLNDNINRNFLEDMCKQFGTIDEVKIYYHPKSKRHLGVGKVVFSSTRCAKACVEKLNNTSKMGKIMTVFVDTMGKARQKLIDDLVVSDKPILNPPSPSFEKSKQAVRTFEYEDMGSHCKTRFYTDPSKDREKEREKAEKEIEKVRRRSTVDEKKEESDSGSKPDKKRDRSFSQSERTFESNPPLSAPPLTPQSSSTPGTPFPPTPTNNFQPGSFPSTPSSFSSGSFGTPNYTPQSNFGTSPAGNMQNMPAFNFNMQQTFSMAQQQQFRMGQPNVQQGNQFGQNAQQTNQFGQYNQQNYNQPGQFMNNQFNNMNTMNNQNRQNFSQGNFGNNGVQNFQAQNMNFQRGNFGNNMQQNFQQQSNFQNSQQNFRRGSFQSDSQNFQQPQPQAQVQPMQQKQQTPAPQQPKLPAPSQPQGNFQKSETSYSAPETSQPQPPGLPTPSLPPSALQPPGMQPPGLQPPGLPDKAESFDKSDDYSTDDQGTDDQTESKEKSDTKTKKRDSFEEERPFSLESRIELLLKQRELDSSFDSGEPETPTTEAPLVPANEYFMEPPLPVHEQPPLPGSDEAIPPLPPMPYEGGMEEDAMEVEIMTEGMVQEVSDSRNAFYVGEDEIGDETIESETIIDDAGEFQSSDVQEVTIGMEENEDDRMSLSSLSSGEEKLELNVPNQHKQPPPFDPSVPPPNLSASFNQQTNTLNPLMPDFGQRTQGFNESWGSSNNLNTSFNSDTSANLSNSFMDGGFQGPLITLDDLKDPHDGSFYGVLNKIITELKVVMKKDLCKKMVEVSAFKSLESWWDDAQDRAKFQAIVKPASVLDKPKTEVAPKQDITATLSSLFEKQSPWSSEGGALGALSSGMGLGGRGGLLGIRSSMPKLPSFRVPKKFRPPSPEPDEDDYFRRPRTPVEEWESDSEKASTSTKESSKKAKKRERAFIYSSSSSEDEKSDSEDEESEDESEEESEEGSGESSGEESEDESSDSSDEESSDEEQEPKTKEVSPDKEIIDVESTDDDAFAKTKMHVDEVHAPGESGDWSSSESEEGEVKSDDEEDKRLSPIREEPELLVEEKVKAPEKKGPTEYELEKMRRQEDKRKAREAEQERKRQEKETQRLEKIAKREAKKAEKEAEKIRLKARAEERKRQREVNNQFNIEHNYFARPPDDMDTSYGRKTDENMSGASDSEATDDAEEVPVIDVDEPPAFLMDHFYCRIETMKRLASMVNRPRVLPMKKGGELDIDKIAEQIHNELMEAAAEEDKVAKTQQLKLALEEEKKRTKAELKKEKAMEKKRLKDITTSVRSKVNRELAAILEDVVPTKPKPRPTYEPRDLDAHNEIMYEIFGRGIDIEDINYLKRTYEQMLADDKEENYWLNEVHWVDHAFTNIPDPVPPKKRKKSHADELPFKIHAAGCARTEGYYKISMQEKASYLWHYKHTLERDQLQEEMEKTDSKCKKSVQQLSREARSNQRRLLTSFADILDSDRGDLLKFNQLKFRKKQLKFAKSMIHDWGLFALEPIAAEEMVIEYVGQSIRASMADEREKNYEKIGIGSSYLFRVDGETIIDATKCGNLARFINHCCNPNCYAKVITVEQQKKIVIYSKRDIDVNEEITYDYKFPLEDEKIPCLCGAQGCRGTLN
ncbi:histone-lysine N-methyltransferase SETD1B-like [Lineus longissimus]|uniref:histone-lysine N-methyltransferase SETD1B-like n=1 Tax=Lineus longissimus TaxID=88925 RepID=UPI002B4F27BB